MEKRLQVFEGQVGGFFAKDAVASTQATLQDRRELTLALIGKRKAELAALQLELAGIEAQLGMIHRTPEKPVKPTKPTKPENPAWEQKPITLEPVTVCKIDAVDCK